MKHKIFKTLLAAVHATMTFCAEADTETVNGIEWDYSVEDGKASIEGGYLDPDIPESTFGAITIPSTLGGYFVTSIGDFAFLGCKSLKSVTIPNSVTSIGRSAFSGCSSLKSVTIPDSVTSIGDRAFEDCSSLTSVTIPNSVTSIWDEAFCGCSSLTSVTIPDSVTSIASSAFCGCSSLTSVTIPDSVTSIGGGAFKLCKGLADSDGFIIIRGVLYDYCGEGKEVLIPNSVTSIGDFAFLGCKSLTSVTIPESVTSIGEGAFCDCRSLTSVTIPNSVTSIGEYAFSVCNSLKSVTIPNSVTSIGEYAFSVCNSLKSVTIPNSVTSIGDCAFLGCKSLTSVTIPDSVTSIGVIAFSGCGELTIFTDKGNADRLRKMLENAGANVKEIIEQRTGEQKANGQEAEEQKSCGFLCGLVLGCVGTIVILGGLFFWIVRRKKKREWAIDKADCSVEVANVSDTVEELNENVCPPKGKWWSPSGRATRSKWWLSRLVLVFSLLLGVKALSSIRESYFENMLFIFSIIIICITVYMCIIVDIKRLHDRNMSGKWILLDYFAKISGVLVLKGVVGIAFLIILGFLDGTHGPNRYGEDLKDRV